MAQEPRAKKNTPSGVFFYVPLKISLPAWANTGREPDYSNRVPLDYIAGAAGAAGAGAAFFFAAFFAGFLAAFLAAGFLAAFLAAFFAAGFLAAFFTAFLAAGFFAAFFTAFLAAFLAGFLAAFFAAFLAGFAAFFTAFLAAFLAGFFAAFLVAMVNSSSVGLGNAWVEPSYKGTAAGLHPVANRRDARGAADGWVGVAPGAVARQNAWAAVARALEMFWVMLRFAEGSLPLSTVEGARVDCCEVEHVVGLTLITRFRKGAVAERKLIMCFYDVNHFAEKIFPARRRGKFDWPDIYAGTNGIESAEK